MNASLQKNRPDPAPGDVATQVRVLSAADLDVLALRANLLVLTGRARHGVASYRIRYRTVDSRGLPAWASAAVLVPALPHGAAPPPVLLYAHGTWFDRRNDMALIDGGEPHAAMVATMYAAQGYVVVAPNYLGYGPEAVADHAYYHRAQQARDAVDALRAARAHSHALGIAFEGPLFVAGYSQGGMVALATVQHLEASGGDGGIVTAAAVMSGAYYIEQSVSEALAGHPGVGASGYLPLLIGSYQNAYGDQFEAPDAIFTDAYASVLSSVPGNGSYAELMQRGVLPALAFDDGSGRAFLLRKSFREAYLSDREHPLRRALRRNGPDPDWTPRTRMLLGCGARDPVAVPANTARLFAALQGRGAPVVLHDLETDRSSRGIAFRQACAADPGLQAYHFLAMPFCNAIARDFFDAAQRRQW